MKSFFAFITIFQLTLPLTLGGKIACGRVKNIWISDDGMRNISKLHFPWIGAIYSRINKTQNGESKLICAASLLSSYLSITAAHCIVDKINNYQRTASEIELFFNVYDLKTRKNSSQVSSIIIHPDWMISNENYDADIALLKLQHSHKNISPICMPSYSIKTPNYGFVLSWIDMEPTDPGYYNHNFDLTYNYPIEYVMPIRSISKCIQLQPRFATISSNRTFCAGGLNSVACLEVANSGASMSIKENDQYYLFGIVSSSFIDLAGCDNITFTLLTEVAKFHNWLNETIYSFGLHTTE